MQYQNDDMDELFRRAAEGYPLKMQKDNWDAVAGKLITPAITTVGVSRQKSKKKNYKLVTLLILLLVTSGATILLFLNNPNKNFNNSASSKNNRNIKSGVVVKIKKDNNTVIPFESNQRPSESVLVTDHTQTVKFQKQTFGQAVTQKINRNNARVFYNDAIVENKNETSLNEDKFEVVMEDVKGINNNNSLGNIVQENQENLLVKEMEIKKKIDSAIAIKQKKIKVNKFYVGVLVGPQFNQVKSQGFSNAGASAGLVIGVNVSKKLAVETGLFISQKIYFSSGTFFKMKKDPSMPANMKIVSLNGKSTVFEIPVTVKYNFIKKNRSNLFGTIGASSYILTNESNDYLAVINGNKERLAINYARNTNYFNAALNASAGYEYKLKQATLRIEPYIQAPLRNVGVGSMPIMSTGLHVGITLPFH